MLREIKHTLSSGWPLVHLLLVIHSAFLLVASTARADTISVDSEVEGPGDGSPSKPYPSLTMAVSAATPGDTLIVKGGYYQENLTIGKQLTITASEGPVLIGSYSQQIDPYALDTSQGMRCLPDIQSGGEVQLDWQNVIDVIVLGDGYLAGEKTRFFDDARHFYENLFDSCSAPCGTDPPCGSGGIPPHTYFPQAFRVQALFTPSAERASEARVSYYRVKIEGDSVARGGWWDAHTRADRKFRARLKGSMTVLSTAGARVNEAHYPSNLHVTVPGDSEPILHNELANLYSHAVVVMLIRAKNANDSDYRPSGRTRRVDTDFAHGVNVAFGSQEEHEFGHAFAYLEDEYISERDIPERESKASRHDPNPADRSLFLLSNLTYSNARCGAIWSHLAPGGRYNPDPFSPIGNLYRGGEEDEGVWHSEYKSLMNGTHENYACDLSGPSTNLRDRSRHCFWCEEIITLRILEKTGQLACGDAQDINQCGRDWYGLWVNTLRDLYYTDPRFDIINRIAAQNRRYASDPSLPPCLIGCAIRNLGTAVYVDGDASAANPDGSRTAPYSSVSEGIQHACGPQKLVLIKPGAYGGPYTLPNAALLSPDGCSSVVLGSPQGVCGCESSGLGNVCVVHVNACSAGFTPICDPQKGANGAGCGGCTCR
jgi:hypothetical protein